MIQTRVTRFCNRDSRAAARPTEVPLSHPSLSAPTRQQEPATDPFRPSGFIDAFHYMVISVQLVDRN